MELDHVKLPDLMAMYKPSTPIPIPQLVVCLQDRHIFAGMIISESQRDACRRLFKRMDRGHIVKIESRRWMMMG